MRQKAGLRVLRHRFTPSSPPPSHSQTWKHHIPRLGGLLTRQTHASTAFPPPSALALTCVPGTGGGRGVLKQSLAPTSRGPFAPLDMCPPHTSNWEPAGQPNTRLCRPAITISSRGDLRAETGGGSKGAQTLYQAGLAPPFAPLVVSPPHRSRWELTGPPELRPCHPLTTISLALWHARRGPANLPHSDQAHCMPPAALARPKHPCQ